MKKEREYDLQDRLVDYAVRIIKRFEALPETKAGKHVSTHRQRENVYVVPPSGGTRADSCLPSGCECLIGGRECILGNSIAAP